jgi:hypothetical protein
VTHANEFRECRAARAPVNGVAPGTGFEPVRPLRATDLAGLLPTRLGDPGTDGNESSMTISPVKSIPDENPRSLERHRSHAGEQYSSWQGADQRLQKIVLELHRSSHAMFLSTFPARNPFCPLMMSRLENPSKLRVASSFNIGSIRYSDSATGLRGG